MNIFNLISLLGGVALFLFGMTLMGDGLKKVAGNKLEVILFKLSSTPVKGILLGTLVTAVIQSSSATSVMVVGFVNSGIMTLNQAITVIIGSIIGTSITGWIISLSSVSGSGWTQIFSTASLSSIIAVVGIFFRMFCKDKSKKHVGDILLGFSVLMFGMSYMSSAVSPLKESPIFIKMITTFSNPFLGIAAGIVFAAVLQSASAAVGILQALSMTGVITVAVAWPLLLGISIGASMPVLISSIGAKAEGKRTAWAYFWISLFGAVISEVIYRIIYILFGDSGFSSVIVGTLGIAALNTLFRLVSGIIILPLAGFIEKILVRTIKQSEEEIKAYEDLDRLDDRFIKYPAMAVEQSKITANSMAAKSKENLLHAIDLIFDYSDDRFNEIENQEDFIDKYEDKLGTYLLKLNTQELTNTQNEKVTEMLHIITDLERISDHAMNIAESAQEIANKSIVFSSEGCNEINVLVGAVKEILDIAIESFINDDTDRQRTVEPLEERIDNLCAEMKLNHVARMQTGKCSLDVGFVFNDLLSNFERVGDHCSNIALAMIEIREDDFDTHSGIDELKNDELYKEYSEKYALR